MLLDLLRSDNYLMINIDFIKIFELRTAVYLSYILNTMHKTIDNNKYFEINRDDIFEITSLSFEEQVTIEDKLIEVNLLTRQEEIASNSIIHLFLDVAGLVNLVANGDEKLLEKVKKLTKLPKTLKTGKLSNRQKTAMGLKYCVKAPNQELLTAYQNWIDGVYANPNGFLSTTAIAAFQRNIDEYAKGDLDLALKIIEIATINGYKDATWAINLFEKDYKRNWQKTHTQPVRSRSTIDKGEVF